MTRSDVRRWTAHALPARAPAASRRRQRSSSRRLLAVAAALAVGLGVPLPAAATPGGPPFPARIDLPDGFLGEGIEKGRGTTFFVGSLADGAIWRGDFRSGSGAVFVPGVPGRVSGGIAYEQRRNRLWVAGGGPALGGEGDVRVYDASSGALLARYEPPGAGLLNDVAITHDAVYVTDSFVAQLAVIPLPADGSLPRRAATLPVTGDLVQTEGFNLNGIVAKDGVLIVAQSSTGKLFRVDPATGVADEVELGGAAFGVVDGLELRGRTLYVVRNVDNRVTMVRLAACLTSGVVLGDLTDPSLDFPTTATVAAGRLWAVNLRFFTPPGPTTQYWITRLPLRP
jgi:hypothetical protein